MERFIDKEWEEAEKSDEAEQYYWVETGIHSKSFWDIRHDNGGRFIKCYKPSVAKLVADRTGYNIYPVNRTRE